MSFKEFPIFSYLFQQLHLPIPSGVFLSLSSFIAAITTILISKNYVTEMLQNPNPLPVEPPQTFDFIIVGAGTAGGMLSARLSANGKFRVLLLEAGGKPLILNDIPYLQPSNLNHIETDWMYKIVPQTHSCFALNNNSFTMNRGKSLGGTSNLNALTYMRGNPKDFDEWAELAGDKQWNYENVLPYFKKFENYHGNYTQNGGLHGTNGPTYITAQSYQIMVKDWTSAGQQLGFSIKDPNAGQTESFGPKDVFAWKGKRWETYHGYIHPASERKNLKIVSFAHVTKINFDSNNRATGVTYFRDGQNVTVLAAKEVILSAGAIGSPQLLMLSGIGPAEHLRSVGIKPIIDLPGVGKNLKDHVTVIIGPFLLNQTVSFIPERNLTLKSVQEYLTKGTGPLTFVNENAFGLISTKNNSNWPNVLLFMSPLGISQSVIKGKQDIGNVKDHILEKYMEEYIGRDANFVSLVLGKPASAGEITLKSNNPFEYPAVNPNYLSEPSDVKALVEAFKFVVKLYEETEAYRRYNATLIPKHFPGCEAYPLRSDEYYECYIRHYTSTKYHLTSTCKMGPINDPMSVVDSNLRVRNTTRLRVVDASVFAEISNANINAPIMMIAEKASDIIFKDWD